MLVLGAVIISSELVLCSLVFFSDSYQKKLEPWFEHSSTELIREASARTKGQITASPQLYVGTYATARFISAVDEIKKERDELPSNQAIIVPLGECGLYLAEHIVYKNDGGCVVVAD